VQFELSKFHCITPFASLFQEAGIKVDDVLVSVNREDVKWLTQMEIKTLTDKAGSNLTLTVVTPMAPTQPAPEIRSVHNGNDTIRSYHSSNSSSDMKQMTGTWKKKMNMTFLKMKKSKASPTSSLRKK